MITWIYRSAVLLGCPLLVYTQIVHSRQGILIGLCVGTFLVLLEVALESVNLLTMTSGVLGATYSIVPRRPTVRLTLPLATAAAP